VDYLEIIHNGKINSYVIKITQKINYFPLFFPSMDPYMWMENLDDERVLKIVDEENKKFRNYVGNVSDKVLGEVRNYYYLPTIWEAKITDKGVFAAINENGRQIIKNIDKGEIILDSKELEEELKDEVLLQGFNVSQDGKLLAYNFSIGGSDEGITRIVNLDSKEILEEHRPSILNIVFLDNGYYFSRFYRKSESPDGMKPPVQRMFFKDSSERMVFGEGLDSNYFLFLKKSNDGNYALLTKSFGWNRSGIYFGPLKEPDKWKKVYSSDSPAESIDFVDGKLYILTHEAEKGKIIAIDDEGNKLEIVREWGYPLEWALIVNNKILAGYLVDASTFIRIYSMDGKLMDEMSFKVLGNVTPFDSRNFALLKYESFLVPYRLYKFDDSLHTLDERKIDGNFVVKEDFAKSKDGTKIHYFIVEGKSKRKLVWVFGYGGFNIALKPRFFPQVIPFIKRGGTFVMANLRGGSEYGEKWHRAGMRENKQNVFDDFIAVLEKLKNEGYKVAAWGRSNGGLLVSATLVQRPDVMDAAIIGYPVIDMLRFHKLYIGRVWIPEYGNPDNPEDREFLERYSPYHNVKKQNYPPIMIYTGLHDDRVHPAHALKFFMKLKELNAPVYLRVETKSGHMGASPETRIRELADMLSFVLINLEVPL
jgi:prolyl oligopeptidase